VRGVCVCVHRRCCDTLTLQIDCQRVSFKLCVTSTTRSCACSRGSLTCFKCLVLRWVCDCAHTAPVTMRDVAGVPIRQLMLAGARHNSFAIVCDKLFYQTDFCRDNYFFVGYILGRYTHDCCPRYLERANFLTLKSNLQVWQVGCLCLCVRDVARRRLVVCRSCMAVWSTCVVTTRHQTSQSSHLLRWYVRSCAIAVLMRARASRAVGPSRLAASQSHQRGAVRAAAVHDTRRTHFLAHVQRYCECVLVCSCVM
jgi:hypothetical protein